MPTFRISSGRRGKVFREELAVTGGEGKVMVGCKHLSFAQCYEGGQIKADELGYALRTHWSV